MVCTPYCTIHTKHHFSFPAFKGGKNERQWRHIDASRPTPKTLNDAAALYTHARSKVEMEMLHNGTSAYSLFIKILIDD